MPADPALRECVEHFVATDEVTRKAGLRDEGETAVPGFPYLRANRLLASFAAEADDGPRFEAWIGALAELDKGARGAELWNGAGLGALPYVRELNSCRTRLIAFDAATPGRRARLRAAVRVPDDYLLAWRVAGVYPLSSLVLGAGIRKWHEEAAAVFATPLGQLPVHGQLQRWSAPRAASLDTVEVRALVDGSRDALGIARPRKDAAERLLAAFAPVWEVDVADDNDRIGTPRRAPQPGVDSARPVEYRLLSHTRWRGQVLLQLAYVVWFGARPGEDRYAGALDGLVWRVTLGADGRPLVYDSIHNCGCYLQFFPAAGLQLRTDLPRHGFERPLVPQDAPLAGPLVVRLSAATHYIERVYADDGARPAAPLGVADYLQLRMGGGGGGAGLFGAHGIVPGSERGERALLWISGIRSPGAMREWGRHATAFVGRRHFDDAYLVESLFEERVTP